MALVLTKVVVSVVVIALLGAIGAVVGSGSREVPEKGARVLGFTAKVRAGGWLTCVATAAILTLTLVSPPGDDEIPVVAGLVVGFGMLSVVTLLEGYRNRLVLTDYGIGKLTWYAKPVLIAWDEVEKVYLGRLGEYVVRGGGTKFNVGSGKSRGNFEWFTAACREHLPEEKYPEMFRMPSDGNKT